MALALAGIRQQRNGSTPGSAILSGPFEKAYAPLSKIIVQHYGMMKPLMEQSQALNAASH
jgi:hypothetical protein